MFFEFVLRSTHFIYKDQFYKKMEGLAMGALLFFLVAIFFKEAFEQKYVYAGAP